MNIYRPIINNILEESSLSEEIDEFRKEGITIETKRFSKIEEIFDNCDFSNCLFTESSFIRVEIKNSKFVGCNFIEARVYHFSSRETIFKYANFSNTSLEEMIFEDSDLSNSSFEESKLKHIYFEKSNLTQALLYRTKLNGIDLSTCEIQGIVTSIEDIKGLTVNNFQAIELSKLLGLTIK